MIKLKIYLIIVCVFCIAVQTHLYAQNNITKATLFADTSARTITVDSTKSKAKIISTPTQKHIPKIATRRSLILPGWGQAYNKEYWKIPLVWGALSIPTITYIYNQNVYKEARDAYEIRYAASLSTATHQDSLNVLSLDTKYQKADINAIQNLRNAARRDRDYSIFWFGIVWLLNVADATVFAHLKDFDVSDNLSMKVHPQFNPVTKTPALGLTFKFKNSKHSLAENFAK